MSNVMRVDGGGVSNRNSAATRSNTPPRSAATARAGGSNGGQDSVRSGENAASVAQRNGVSTGAVLAANRSLSDAGDVHSGQVLDVPASDEAVGTTHTVRAGDTVDSLSQRYSVEPQEIRRVNEIGAGREPYTDEVLLIPHAASTEAAATQTTGEAPPATAQSARVDAAVRDLATARENQATANAMANMGAYRSAELRDGTLGRAVANAESELRDALHAELESIAPPPQPRVTTGGLDKDNIDSLSVGVLERHADEPSAQEAIAEAVTSLRIDLEVDALFDSVGTGGDIAQRLQRLSNGLDGASDELHDRVTADARTDALLGEAATDIEARLEGIDGIRDEERIGKVNDALAGLEEVLTGLDPELGTGLVERVAPSLMRAAEGVEIAGVMVDGMWAEGWGSMARIADLVADGEDSDTAIESLADLMLHTGIGPGNHAIYLPLSERGEGLSLYLTVAGVAARDNDHIDPDFMLDQVVQSLDDYYAGTFQDAFDAYVEHSEELGWKVNNLGASMDPEQLQAAIDDHIDNAGPEWTEQLEALEATLAGHGVQALRHIHALGSPPASLAGHQDRLEDRLGTLADNGAAALAVSVAVSGSSDRSGQQLLNELPDIPEAITLLQGAQLANRVPGLVKALADAHVTHSVLPSIDSLDLSNPSSVEAVRSQLDSLRSGDFAQAWSVDRDQLDSAVDALEAVLDLPDGSPDAIAAGLSEYDQRLQNLGGFSNETPLGQAFRGVGLALGLIGLTQRTANFADDPSVLEGAQVLVDAAGVTQQVGDLATGLGWVSDSSALGRLAGNANLGKVLGGIGIAFSLVGVVSDVSEGDLTSAGLGTLGIAGSGLATFGKAAWAGPVGTAVGLIAAGGSVYVSHRRHQEAITRFETEASQRFLSHAGFTDSAAAALIDQSGQGLSPVPYLFAYGEAHGFSSGEVVEYINSLSSDELVRLRSVAHREMDRLEGGVSDLALRNGDTQAQIAEIREIAQGYAERFGNFSYESSLEDFMASTGLSREQALEVAILDDQGNWTGRIQPVGILGESPRLMGVGPDSALAVDQLLQELRIPTVGDWASSQS